MARIRSISPDMRTSETVAAWPREVRYAWSLLWGYCDDYGRGLDNAKIVAADCFPLDDDVTAEVMAAWLDTFEKADSICRYEADGKRYLHCLNWRDYQKPQHPGKVRIPPCPIHETAAHTAWAKEYGRSSGESHEDLMSASPTRGRGSTEVSKEEEVSQEEESRGGRSSGRPAPPVFPDHCPAHRDIAVPGNCGTCKDQREANKVQARRLSVVGPSNPATKPHCGQCDETRHRETQFGVIRCPDCHPRAEEESA